MEPYFPVFGSAEGLKDFRKSSKEKCQKND